MFTHLHVHSHYSLLDGLPKVSDLVRSAKEKGYAALALTDHGAMYGAIEFYKRCKTEGVKPIIGLEAYLAPRGLDSKKERLEDKPSHLTLLAKNFAGYKNLMQLTTIAHLQGFYYKPRIDLETLKKFREGLIVLSGCTSSELSKLILSERIETARQLAKQYQEIFGASNYYLEIQRQPIAGDPEFQKKRDGLNRVLAEISRELNIPLVATADCHYLHPDDSEAQDALVCVETGRTVEDRDRLDMRAVDLSLKDEKEMAELFSDLPDALQNAGKIADEVNIEIPLRQLAFPNFDLPPGETNDSQLRRLALEGLAVEYGSGLEDLRKNRPEVMRRLEYELDIISKKGYSSYFLVVSDFVKWTRGQGIISTTRGSAAGSLVAYTLGITSVNPLEYQLPFERFLNLERPLPPDIDTDFADNRRDEVIEYVAQKYGKDKVAQIVTFGSMLARAAVRDIGRVLGVPYGKCDKIAKLIPFGRQGFHMTIAEAVKISPELKTAYEQDDDTKKILDLAKKVEGVARHASIHAAGVVISPVPLTNYTPLRADAETGTVTTQYDMHSIEETGLVKMDFLGIRNLSILGRAVEIVKRTKNAAIDLYHLPLDDKKTFELLAEGRTIGLFQLGGSGMTKYLKDLKPTNVRDIMAMVALYRPGPMESIPEFIRRKHNPELIDYLDPRLQDILSASYGVLTYQDDVLLIAIKLAGYSWEEADKLRKAMGKKIPREMAEQKEKFLEGCMKNGLPSKKALKLWSLIEPFAAYGFNKAHAASYGIVAYQTAYMKANFPTEYMTAVLSAEAGNMENVAEAVAECNNLNITVLPPDVNESRNNFTYIDDAHIRFGLGAIKNLGSDVIEKIIEERNAKGKFSSLSDFIARTHVRNFNKKSWEALVKSGALEAFGERGELLANTENILNVARGFSREMESAQNSLFGARSPGAFKIQMQKAPPASDREKLAWEKELLGLYVTSHPLQEFRPVLQKLESVARLKTAKKEISVAIGGILTRVKTILTKRGEQMCFAEMEDLTGSIELVVFPRTFAEARALLVPDKIIKVSGKFQLKDEEPKILADKIEELTISSPPARGGDGEGVGDPTSERMPERQVRLGTIGSNADEANKASARTEKLVTITITADADPGIFQKLKSVFEKHPGDVRVALDIPSPHGAKKPIVTDFYVNPTDETKGEIKKVLQGK